MCSVYNNFFFFIFIFRYQSRQHVVKTIHGFFFISVVVIYSSLFRQIATINIMTLWNHNRTQFIMMNFKWDLPFNSFFRCSKNIFCRRNGEKKIENTIIHMLRLLRPIISTHFIIEKPIPRRQGIEEQKNYYYYRHLK